MLEARVASTLPVRRAKSGLRECGAQFAVMSEDSLVRACARELASGKALGWFQGRMEFGPRALGNRSILADPRSPSMQRTLNLKVKYRESFRPFAPAVLREVVSSWFDLDVDSPCMLVVADVLSRHLRAPTGDELALSGLDKLRAVRSTIPAVTHVDGSARIQTVDPSTHPLFYGLIAAFKASTGCPVLVNTSFNVRGEPIVCTPDDAFQCFMGTEIEVLAVGRCLLHKDRQDPALRRDYRAQIAPN